MTSATGGETQVEYAAGMDGSREGRLLEAFVGVADTLIDEYDVADLMYRLVEQSVDLLEVSAAGLLLADGRGRLQVMAASDEQSHMLELFQLQNREGPCLECFHTGAQVLSTDISVEIQRWPLFAPAAEAAGFRAVYALPLRLRSETLGCLNLFAPRPTALPASDLRVAQALADVATIALLQERAIRRGEVLAEQLETALNSRVIIEQAKGVLAERGRIGMDAAFRRLRGYARSTNSRLAQIARAVVDGELDAAAVLEGGESPASAVNG
jgi:transcriptional regulator with GAF, ATPase, and Fis domain